MLSRAPRIFICHNVLPHERSLIDTVLARIAFAGADAFIVQSTEDLRKLGRIRRRAPVIVHPHPIYDFFAGGGFTRESARAAIGERAGPLLLFFGYIRPYKGLRYLIEALPLIRDRIPVRLLVVGEFYDDPAPYEELVAKLGLSDAVRFVNRYVGNEEVEAFFTASDLVILPYLSATQSGIVQIAIAFDRPVVVTAVGGLPEAVVPDRTGFVVPPRDQRALAAAITRFFDEEWAARMEPHFAGEKRRFSWGAMADAIEGLLGSIEKR
jgi:glycosyltransferase involved in cell wall biosynthesis